MPWIKVWIHFVWSTANHEPWLTDEIRPKVFQHIRENARTKGIYIDLVNGYIDHIHCLISLGSDQTIENVMQLIKGESSFWINQNKLTKTKFAWQKEYFAVSVNPAGLDPVRRYIAKQEEHHRNSGFKEEFEDFLIRAGFERFEDKLG
ncbi:MAG TPA: IS200/IS605 family transposase [Pyrinomonadaceae bacterium]|nr:IS200/IS605 family transposase [Pyrinomonadaceae bacterium]